MFQEKIEKERFHGNRGREAFVKQALDILDSINCDDMKETCKLLEKLQS